MLYYLLYPLREYFTVFNVFKYITFRAAFASITAFLIIVILADQIIMKISDALYQLALRLPLKGTLAFRAFTLRPGSHNRRCETLVVSNS